MNRRDCLRLVGTLPFVPVVAKGLSTKRGAARRTIVDGQAGIFDPYAENPYGPNDPYARFSRRAVEEMHQSGLTVTSFTVNEVGNAPDVWLKTIQNIAEQDLWIASNSNILRKVAGTDDIRNAKADDRIAVLYNIQDTSLIGADLERVAVLKGLGVRVMQLTYNVRNLSGDGCLEPSNAGISILGRATIARIEREKVLLDLSHAGGHTVAEAIGAATRPMTISHTGCRSVTDYPRNQWDSELKACADKGGVVGIYWMPYLAADRHATSTDLLRHMNHARNVCGEDHVSVGTDSTLFRTEISDQARAKKKEAYEHRRAAGVAAPDEGPDVFNIVWDWDSHMRFELLANGLAKEGWTEAQIDKVLGDNLMRLYAETWEA